MAAKQKAEKEKKSASGDADPFEALNKELDGLSIASGADDAANDLRGYISTGCFVLDAEIGSGVVRGGYPMGRFTEIFGTEGTGKTTLATHAIVACQQGRGTLLRWVEEKDPEGRLLLVPRVEDTPLHPGLAILIDSEFKWPLDRAVKMGVEWQKMKRITPTTFVKKGKQVDQPLSLEYCLEQLEKVLEKVNDSAYFQRPDVPVLVVWDSLAASPIEAELEGDGLQEGIASKARKVRAAMRRMTGLLARLNVTVIIVNQVYDRIGIPGVEASGGRGLKFHSSHRMSVRKASMFKVSGVDVGIVAKVKAVKSSICPPTHDTEIPIRFSTGIDDDLTLLEFFLAKGRKFDTNPVTVAGAWLKITPPGEGAEEISFQYSGWSDILRKHPEVRDHLESEVMRYLRTRRG